MHEAKKANSDDLVLTYFVRTGHVTRIEISFRTNGYYITSDTHIRNIRLIAGVTAEIFKIKNCSVGNLFKYATKNLIGITFKNLGSCVHHPNQIN